MKQLRFGLADLFWLVAVIAVTLAFGLPCAFLVVAWRLAERLPESSLTIAVIAWHWIGLKLIWASALVMSWINRPPLASDMREDLVRSWISILAAPSVMSIPSLFALWKHSPRRKTIGWRMIVRSSIAGWISLIAVMIVTYVFFGYIGRWQRIP